MFTANAYRHPAAIVALVALLFALPIPANTHAGDKEKKASTVIRVAPSPPVINDEARLSELAARRARVAEKIGATGILILFSTEPRVY
ncbi:MAG: hypothetical protein H7Y30_15315, partial [Pyrinomonadaceae bacterium]|nr:hypothetical protein [Pyrinomonadaceae bacterium]